MAKSKPANAMAFNLKRFTKSRNPALIMRDILLAQGYDPKDPFIIELQTKWARYCRRKVRLPFTATPEQARFQAKSLF